MKKTLTLLLAVMSLSVYSQITIPTTSAKGTIITQNDQTIEYKDLKYQKGKVTYINLQNGLEEFLYDNSVKNIQESNSTQLPVADNQNQNMASQSLKLTAPSDIKNYLIQQKDAQYMKGKSLNNLGTAFIVGGGTCFLVGGLLNLSSASDANVNSGESKGTPVPLIIGLLGAGTGVVMKVAGHSQMKKAINNYQNADRRKFTPNYYVLNNRNGMGMMMTF
jgi:hypothetical protein